jgi:hypothetical protein
LVQEGLKRLAGKFASLDHVGPRDAAEFEEALDRDERAIRQWDAFEKVNHLLGSPIVFVTGGDGGPA